MSREPTPTEIENLSGRMESMFVISHEEALVQAAGLLALAHGWGAGKPDGSWDQIVKRKLSKSHEWRSKEMKKEFEKDERFTVDGYNRLIDGKKRNQWMV